MPEEALWLLLFVVAILVAPFATLRAVSHFRSRGQRPDKADRPSASGGKASNDSDEH